MAYSYKVNAFREDVLNMLSIDMTVHDFEFLSSKLSSTKNKAFLLTAAASSAATSSAATSSWP